MQEKYGKFGPYTSPYKDHFKPNKSDKTIAYCICRKKGDSQQICNAIVNPTYGTSVMQQHLLAFHPEVYRAAEEKRFGRQGNSEGAEDSPPRDVNAAHVGAVSTQLPHCHWGWGGLVAIPTVLGIN